MLCCRDWIWCIAGASVVMKLQMWIYWHFLSVQNYNCVPTDRTVVRVLDVAKFFPYFRLISHSGVMIISAYHIISLIKFCILPTVYIYKFNVITKWKVIILLCSINSSTFEMEIKCFICGRNGIFTHTFTLQWHLSLNSNYCQGQGGFKIYCTLQCVHKSKAHYDWQYMKN